MALAFLLPVKMMAKASSSDNSTLLWYNAPAQQWLGSAYRKLTSGRYGVWRNHGREYSVE